MKPTRLAAALIVTFFLFVLIAPVVAAAVSEAERLSHWAVIVAAGIVLIFASPSTLSLSLSALLETRERLFMAGAFLALSAFAFAAWCVLRKKEKNA
jgi:hypothetical protein